MSTLDEAAEVIRTWQQRHKNELDNNTDWAAQNLAGDLNQAGLLAPELPEPRFRDANGPVWEIPLHDGLSVVTVRVLYGNVSVGMRGLGFYVNSAEARKIAAAILAAADYTEEA
uniref:Uncharacterized protein n=1 Tax=Actinobacteria phage HS02 TaxID=3056388 RepID=A0AA50ACX0_9VIRU|nr:MAG: hypothetical protein [Actinobacteria phage HS02]